MGGSNPYVHSKYALPTQPYKITFMPMNETVEVDPTKLPYSRDGAKGSLLEIALGHDIDLDHACGGVCACSTCHVIVRKGLESCSEATEDEEDQLDEAPSLTPQSRLGCQCIPDGTADLEIEIPEWNRNLVKEQH